MDPLQDKMATLSTNSIHRVMQNAAHTSLTEDKTDSSISSQAILDVVHAVRVGTPLAKQQGNCRHCPIPWHWRSATTRAPVHDRA